MIKLISKHILLMAMLIAIITICNSCSNAPDYNENSYAKNWLQLNGKVKSVCYNSLMTNDSLANWNEYLFDNFGRLTEEKSVNNREELLRVYEHSNNNDYAELSFQVSSLKKFSKFKNGILVIKTNYKDSLDSNGRLVKQTEINNDKQVRTTNLDYSLDGNLLSINSLNLKNGKFIFEYFWFDTNDVLRKEIYIRNTKDSIQERKIMKKYDAKGNILLSESRFENDWLENRKVYTYNSLSKIIGYKYYGQDSTIYAESFVSYDSDGLKIDSIHQTYWWSNHRPSKHEKYKREVYTFTKDGKFKGLSIMRKDSLQSHTTYLYSEEGDLTETKFTTHNGGKIIYYYDEMNHKNKTQVFDSTNCLINEEIIKLTYDSEENIIQKTSIENDTIKESFSVKIEYY